MVDREAPAPVSSVVVDGGAKLDEALALFDEGRACIGRGDYALAVEKLKTSVARAPTGPSLAALGQSLFLSARYVEAVIHLAAAVGMGEASSAVRLMLASALARSGDRNEALRRLREMLRDEPENAAVREEMKSVLMDSSTLADAANRQCLRDALKTALPEIRIDSRDAPIYGLALVGRYIVSWAAPPADDERLQRAFSFLRDQLLGAGAEGADLLSAVVFPTIVPWHSAVAAARKMLTGRARHTLDDAVALWGPPLGEQAPLVTENVPDELRFLLPDLALSGERPGVWGRTVGRRYVAAVEAGATEAELKCIGRLLSRMAGSDDATVRDAFDGAVDEIVGADARFVIEAARRDLTGLARAAIENIA